MKRILFAIALLFSVACVNAQIIDVSSAVIPSINTPALTTDINTFPITFTTNSGSASTLVQIFVLNGSNLTNGVVINGGSVMEVATDGVNFVTPKNLTISVGQITGQPLNISVRIKASAAPGTYNDVVTISSIGVPISKTVAYNAVVNTNTPTITVVGSISPFNTTAGIESSIQTQSVSAVNLSANMVITPPAPIVVSIDGTNYASTQTVTPTGGGLPGSPITVSFKIPSTATSQSISGTLSYASTGATTQSFSVTGAVSAGGGANDTLNVNLWDSVNNIGKVNLNAPTLWNEWNINEVNVQPSFNFKYQTGVQSPITASWDAINSYVDNGSGYNSSTTSGFPVPVFRVALFNTTTPNTFTLAHLPTATNGYRLEIITSRSNIINNNATNETWTIGATSHSLNAKSNDATVVFDNITPVSGTITVTVSSANGFWYMCGFRLIKKN